MSRLVWLPVLIVLLIGCATPTLYSWGHYEELIYISYAAPGKVPPQMQVEKLEEDYQKARAENKRMPPGFHAHLGYLYFQLGKLDQAQQELETERADFPESAVFIDRLLANLKKF
jgi:hypothetical protein